MYTIVPGGATLLAQDSDIDFSFLRLNLSAPVKPHGRILIGGAFTMLGGGGTGMTTDSHIGRIHTRLVRTSLLISLLFVLIDHRPLAAQDITRMSFTPPVVPDTYAQPVRFEATVTGHPATVAFEYNGLDRPMFDDGTGGDLLAGEMNYKHRTMRVWRSGSTRSIQTISIS